MYYSKQRTARMAAKLFEHVRNKTTDRLDDRMEYDLTMYSDPEVAKLEQTRIFQCQPMMAAHSSQLPEDNSYLVVQLNQSSVLLTRKEGGEIAAYLNVCRHRGATLVQMSEGKRPRFVCGYHGWSYNNDGEHLGISFEDTFGDKPCGKYALTRLPVEERHGFIWVVEDPQASINIEKHLGDGFDQAMSEYGFDQWHFYREGIFDFPQNWKVMMDGLLDGYHVKFLHGATIGPYFHYNIMAFEIFGEHALWGTPRKAIDNILDEKPGTSPLEKYAIFGNFIAVNSALVLHPHHVEFWTIYQDPLNPNHCRVHLRHLTPINNHDERGKKIMEKNWEIAVGAIVSEDVPMGNSVQASANTPFAKQATLGRNEVANQLFHKSYQRLMNK